MTTISEIEFYDALSYKGKDEYQLKLIHLLRMQFHRQYMPISSNIIYYLERTFNDVFYRNFRGNITTYISVGK